MQAEHAFGCGITDKGASMAVHYEQSIAHVADDQIQQPGLFSQRFVRRLLLLEKERIDVDRIQQLLELTSRDTWNPAQYQRFGAEGEQPFFDLLAMVPTQRPRRVVDLGCGSGYWPTGVGCWRCATAASGQAAMRRC